MAFRLLTGLTTELGKTAVTELVAGTKTEHTPGKGGLADYHGMNGRELRRFVSRATTMLMPADAASAAAASNSPSSGDSDVATMIDWLDRLSGSLLTGGALDSGQITALRALFDEMNTDWHAVTGDHHFPKLHMLRHCAEFAARHRILGAVSESQIESYHTTFNILLHEVHRNMMREPHKAMCRSLADTSVRAVQPLLLAAL